MATQKIPPVQVAQEGSKKGKKGKKGKKFFLLPFLLFLPFLLPSSQVLRKTTCTGGIFFPANQCAMHNARCAM
jgi:hypothetical protein